MGSPNQIGGNKPATPPPGEHVDPHQQPAHTNQTANAEAQAEHGHVEHGHDSHDSLEHTKHTAHQVKSSFATSEKVAAGLTRGGRAAAAVTNEVRVAGRILAPVTDVAEHLTSEQTTKITKATTQLEQYHGLQKTAERASRTQSSVARRINNMLTQGAEPAAIESARGQLKTATDAANRAHLAVQEMKPAADQAKATIREVAAEGSRLRDQAPGLLRRAHQAIANTRTGRRALDVAKLMARSRVGSAIHAIAESKAVHTAGKVLIVATAAIDGFAAHREDATVLGNAFRMGGQAATSGGLYTAAGTVVTSAGGIGAGAVLLPVFVAESFWWDGPHVTGTLQSAVQTGGVAVDYLTGNTAQADRALANLDQEMKEGKYGGVIKGANYFGQALADEGVDGVVSEAVDYWSNISPKEAWRDVKDVWNWLF